MPLDRPRVSRAGKVCHPYSRAWEAAAHDACVHVPPLSRAPLFAVTAFCRVGPCPLRTFWMWRLAGGSFDYAPPAPLWRLLGPPPRPGRAHPASCRGRSATRAADRPLRLVPTNMSIPQTTLSAVLDSHGVEHIDLLKVDVEGAELEVLCGLDDERGHRIGRRRSRRGRHECGAPRVGPRNTRNVGAGSRDDPADGVRAVVVIHGDGTS